MSAFVVSKKTIDLLVTVVVEEASRSRFCGVPQTLIEDADAFGQMLLDENHKSVNHRYFTVEEPAPPPRYEWKRYPGALDPVVILKQIACYEYQACEHDAWGESLAKKLCAELRDRMIFALPGFEAAPWGIPA